MKRGFVFFVVFITITIYILMNHQYYQLVSSAKDTFKSNQNTVEHIATIEGSIIDGNLWGNSFIAKINKVDGQKVNYKWRLYQYSSNDNVELRKQYLNSSSFVATIDLNQVQFLSPKNHSGFDYDRYLYAKGITKQFKIMTLQSLKESNGNSILNLRAAVLEKINFIINFYLEGDTNSLVKALILGEKIGFDHYDFYKELGLAHLFAISGLHFGILFLFLKKALSFLPYNISSGIGLSLLFILIVIVGWPYSAQRAFYIICYNEVNQVIGKKKDIYMSIAFSILVIIILQPHAILSTSLHLSYYAYISIVLIFPLLNKYKLKNVFLESIRFSFIIQLILLPASLYYFQKINLYGFISNFVMVPIIGIVLPVCFIFIVIGLLGIKITLMANFLTFLVNLMDQISTHLPLKTSSFITFKQLDFLVVVWLILLFFLCHTLWHLYKKKKPIIFITSVLLVLILVISELPSNDITKVISFDVGHGDMTLLKSKWLSILVDTGDGKNNCEAILRGEGIHRLDALVISHAHNDHYGGAIDLINHMQIKYLILNEDTYNLLKEGITNDELQVLIIKDNTLHINDLSALSNKHSFEIDIIPILGEHYLTDPNENALIVRFEVKSNLGYLLGDISKEMIGTLEDLDEINIVKSAHHGSSTSFNTDLYNNEDLQVVFTSCSNKYSMPDFELESFLIQNKIKHLTTYSNGEITLSITENKIVISSLIKSYLN